MRHPRLVSFVTTAAFLAFEGATPFQVLAKDKKHQTPIDGKWHHFGEDGKGKQTTPKNQHERAEKAAEALRKDKPIPADKTGALSFLGLMTARGAATTEQAWKEAADKVTDKYAAQLFRKALEVENKAAASALLAAHGAIIRKELPKKEVADAELYLSGKLPGKVSPKDQSKHEGSNQFSTALNGPEKSRSKAEWIELAGKANPADTVSLFKKALLEKNRTAAGALFAVWEKELRRGIPQGELDQALIYIVSRIPELPRDLVWILILVLSVQL